jgi:hypothetical protein
MKLKIPIILIILVGLGVGGFFVWRNYFTPKEFYKGVWMPALGASVIPEGYLPEGLLPEGVDISVMEPVFADYDKAKEAGINTFAFQMGYFVNEQGELSLIPGEEDFIASFIDEAHSRGFKIWLNPEILHKIDKGNPSEMRRIPEEWIENTDLIENFKDAIVETAKLAEEHNVEIFSPSSEMHVNIGGERSRKLLAEIKPRIDAVYSGKICLRGEWPGGDLSDYSCFGPTIDIPKNEEEKNELAKRIEEKTEDKDIELIMGELWEGNDWQGSQEDAKRGFEMGLEAARSRVSGIFILDTGRDYIQLFPESFESTIKEFYSGFGEDLIK